MRREEERRRERGRERGGGGGDPLIARPSLIFMLLVTGKTSGAFSEEGEGRMKGMEERKQGGEGLFGVASYMSPMPG